MIKFTAGFLTGATLTTLVLAWAMGVAAKEGKIILAPPARTS